MPARSEQGGPTPPQEGKESLRNQTFAFVFPPQGVQEVGMGLELYQKSKAARGVFKEADYALGFNLSRLIFEGPPEALQDTINSQPAIMVVSIAAWEAWKEQSGNNAVVSVVNAGHSLGEYTSLVVSGVLPFNQGITLVRERGRLMKQASKKRPGGMAAISGLDEFTIDDICAETGVEIGSINTKNQIVLSGDKRAIARAVDFANIRGARKAEVLKVSGAFHSSFMWEAQEGLREATNKLHFNDPLVPIVANTSAKPLTRGEEIPDELANGLYQRVLWKDTVNTMIDQGVSAIVEFGPGRVLSGFAKQIKRDLNVISVNNFEAVQKLAQLLQQPANRNNPLRA